MAVGPSDLLLMTNGEITSMSKTGVLRWTDLIEGGSGFWGGLGAGGFVFDPECCWDPHANRFLAMASERTAGRSYFLFAQRESNLFPQCDEHPDHLASFDSVFCTESP